MISLMFGRLLLGEGEQGLERDHALGQAVVHVGDVVGQDLLHRGLPVGLDVVAGVEAVERGLHLRAIGRHRRDPALVVGVVDRRDDDLADRHGAVSGRLQDLVDLGHRRRGDRRLAGPEQHQIAALVGEHRQDDGMLGQDVAAVDVRGPVVEREHADIELQEVARGDVARVRRRVARDVGEIVGKGGRRLRRCRPGGKSGREDPRGGGQKSSFHQSSIRGPRWAVHVIDTHQKSTVSRSVVASAPGSVGDRPGVGM